MRELSSNGMMLHKIGTFIEGSLEVKLATIWTDEKHSHVEAEPGRNSDV